MNISRFLKETRGEMKHVIWPTRTRALTYAAVVIILSIAIGYFLGGFDALFQAGLRTLLGF